MATKASRNPFEMAPAAFNKIGTISKIFLEAVKKKLITIYVLGNK